ncbi:S-type pyocin domain-containing protein [Vibrio parahaemolyticus]|uniref:T6SS effector antibacterial DNase n=1 Tax=Vibrio parahaemolyticus TaxID=670 RepID=UPI00111F3A8B|nr:S-type pyocin domain-containing protein [Vibrio parahaemolyticus]HDM8240572.1 S-type pyocin domain-containing protein [Vibrio campbellii]EGQ9120264.1 S-type Pyocin domain-containing protein [Vibrio parahaemolyticus]EGQ9476334.1 S-type Pyocin domain-containing protein [Vibrio parahaemolyticus]EJG0185076.1 S-type pyocin domain-containing protein [Vibrio parahaemolyticus]EJG0189252.1 S-type pyocin domain-containing protein [Vibrio parahaemolyticus]
MAYEFGQVEGGFNELNESELKTAIPSGMGFKAFLEQLRQGHLVLLTDSPSTPMLLSESGTMGEARTWTLNSQATDNLEPAAQNALLARTRMSGSSAGYSRSKSLHPPLPMPTYIPEPPRPDYSDEPPKLKYEYSFEIACSQDSVRKAGNCHFILTKTKNEVELGRWAETKTEHGTRYTIQTAFDEPKRLVAQVASRPMGISPTHPVKVRNIGAQVANEGFIPVTPTVQLGERLGFPTEGFYYHFHDNQLVQEYRLQGDKRWSFYATLSRHQRLDPERGYNTDQTAILVFWKLGGKVVENQYLVYLERQITRDELDNLTDDWLNEHGVKLDILQLLEATKHPIIKRTEAAKPAKQKQPEPVNHIVQTDPETGTRETWAKIANQYGLAPKALLDLNPQYDADPMSLSVGDSLNVQKPQPQRIEKESVYEIPPESPKRFNQPLNTFYGYTGHCLADTSIVSISNERLVEKDIPVVNLKILSTESKATDYGKLAFLALPASTAGSNLGIVSTNTASTLGQWSISGEALSSFARVGGGLVAALWPSQLGDGTLDGNPEFATSDTTTMRVRFNMYTDENGKQQIVGIKTGEGSAYGDRVAKREAVQQGQHFIAELDNGITITWTPDGSTDVLTPDTVLPENDQLDVHNIWVRPIEEHEQEIGTVLYPEEDLAEYIVTFPADAGLPPLYLVFRKTARDESGVVTGNGEDITGIWLENASEGLGAPIPSQIADKLRGKEFSSFDAFRSAFWKEVSKNEELIKQFSTQNQARIKLGKAPKTRSRDKVGKRNSFELHHVNEIQHGGKVYDVDNIRINTPKNHINIHKGFKE